MKKRYSALIALVFLGLSKLSGQVIYHEDFSGITLVNGAAHLPVGYTSIKTDTFLNNPGPLNFPFDLASYSSDGWAIKMINSDTCAVSTSAVTSSGVVERWIVTPVIYGITSQSKLIWKAGSYAPYRKEGNNYEVRVTTDTSLPILASQFTPNPNQVFFGSSGRTGYASRAVSLSAYNGLPIRIAFRIRDFNSPVQSWQFILEEFSIINSTGTVNLALDNLYAEPFSAAGDSLEVSCNFNNAGSAISGYTWHVSIGNFYNDSLVFTNPLNTNGSEFHTIKLQLPLVAPGVYPLKTWISTIVSASMEEDIFHANDTIHSSISIIPVPVIRNVLTEEMTGAWCGNCPEGQLEMEALISQRPWLIPVAVHTGDSMTFASGFAVANYYNAGFPSIDFDRMNMIDDGDYWAENDAARWGWEADKRRLHASPASVGIINQTYDWQTRQISVTVVAAFFNDATGPFRMNCWLTENNVTGPVDDTVYNGWNNNNYYNTDSSSAFFGMGGVLDATEYKHQHVLDTMLSYGPWGDAGIIPDTVLAGSTFVQTYSITLPLQQGNALRWKPLDISAVAFVSVYNDFPHNQFVVNATSAPMTTGIISNDESGSFISVYPNPAGKEVTLKILLKTEGDVQAELFNIEGQRIFNNEYTGLMIGENTLRINMSGLADGIYIMKIITPDGVVSCKIVHR